jgi:hypothetical protein
MLHVHSQETMMTLQTTDCISRKERNKKVTISYHDAVAFCQVTLLTDKVLTNR